jgi:UDP-glucose 4-epimerase
MKALIIGGGGGIGLHLARRLHNDGWTVDIVDNLSRGYGDGELQAFVDETGSKAIYGDFIALNESGDIGGDYDVIHHLAALLGVQNVLENSYRVLTLNVQLTEAALECASRQKNLRRFVYYSTSEVYAGTLTQYGLTFPTPVDTSLTVSDLTSPRTSYMLSKIYGEALCHQSGAPFTIFRPHNIYGPRMGVSHVIPQVMKRLLDGKAGDDFEIFSPDHQRTFCFVEDAVEWIARLSVSEQGVNETYNLGCQTPEITMEALTQLIATVVDRHPNFVTGEQHAGSPSRRCPDTHDTVADSGYTAQTSLEQGISRTYEWYAPVLQAAS